MRRLGNVMADRLAWPFSIPFPAWSFLTLFFAQRQPRISGRASGSDAGRGSAAGLGRWLTACFCAAMLLLSGTGLAHAASTCPSPRAISVVAGGEYYEDYTNAPCSQFGLTGTLVAPLYGTLEDSNATNAVRYRNTDLSATSDTFTVRDDVAQPIVYNVTITSAITLSPCRLA